MLSGEVAYCQREEWCSFSDAITSLILSEMNKSTCKTQGENACSVYHQEAADSQAKVPHLREVQKIGSSFSMLSSVAIAEA